MCIGWLKDCVFAIREAAIANLRKLIDVFGVEWAKQHIIPQVLEAHKHTNYLYRMTVLYSIIAIGPAVGPEVLPTVLLPMVLHMTADPVANVRFNAAKALRHLIPFLDHATVFERVKPCLATMTDDSDKDVRYFATQGLQCS